MPQRNGSRKRGKDERPQNSGHKLNYRYKYFKMMVTYSTLKRYKVVDKQKIMRFCVLTKMFIIIVVFLTTESTNTVA